MIDFTKLPSPCYVMEEERLRQNLQLIKSVKERAGVNIILAFKAFALWKSFPIVREYIGYSTASSVSEAQLAYEEMGNPAHTYAPAYTDEEFPLFLQYSSHITFNSCRNLEAILSARLPRVTIYPADCGLIQNTRWLKPISIIPVLPDRV